MKIEVRDTARARLAAIAARVGDLSPLMTLTGRHMMTSVRRNFDVGGRPEWDELKNVEVAPKGTRRRKGSNQRIQGKTRLGGPLVLSGDLRGSIDFHAETADLVLLAHPDPALKAPVHQWGVPDTKHGGSGRLAGKYHNVSIPARPFLMFQPEDLDWFRKALLGWIRVGSGGVPE